MQEKLAQLKQRIATISDLYSVAALLNWDLETYMPKGGTPSRADQLGTVGGLTHEFFIDEEVGALLEDLSQHLGELDYDSDEASQIRVLKREYDKATKVPTELVSELYSQGAVAREAWKQARESNDFGKFQPHLEKTVELVLKFAEALGPKDNPYDALLDYFEPGLDYASISAVFSALKPGLVALIGAIAENAGAVDDSVLKRSYDQESQLAFARMVATDLGYDFNHGRLDLAAHPFTTVGAADDIRITTRINLNFLNACLMSVIHEAGHGIHLQNLSPTLYRSRLEQAGLSTAESQSRFYENIIGRSRPFWQHYYPKLQGGLTHLSDTDVEAFYRAINKSEPGLIRVEADEVTYGMHIMLRFELENEIVNGKVKVADLPKEWNARMEAYLGLVPPTDSDGVLQDIHWSQGAIGYFPDYLLGNIFAAQLWEKLQEERPQVHDEIRAGNFAPITGWLREKIHRHGNKFTFDELVERSTGKSLQWEPYMNYLKTKYEAIYGL